MKNLFILFLFHLLNKSIKINIGDRVFDSYVSQIDISRSWDGVKTIQITLKNIKERYSSNIYLGILERKIK
jgi:hypothetical protein